MRFLKSIRRFGAPGIDLGDPLFLVGVDIIIRRVRAIPMCVIVKTVFLTKIVLSGVQKRTPQNTNGEREEDDAVLHWRTLLMQPGSGEATIRVREDAGKSREDMLPLA